MLLLYLQPKILRRKQNPNHLTLQICRIEIKQDLLKQAVLKAWVKEWVVAEEAAALTRLKHRAEDVEVKVMVADKDAVAAAITLQAKDVAQVEAVEKAVWVADAL